MKLCSICGENIPESRLKAMPAANTCVICAETHKPSKVEPNPSQDYGKCPKCGSNLKLCRGPRVDFIGCSGYPDCTYKEWLQKKIKNE